MRTEELATRPSSLLFFWNAMCIYCPGSLFLSGSHFFQGYRRVAGYLSGELLHSWGSRRGGYRGAESEDGIEDI